ncbi:hypothetical protein TcasGA2_TC033394 [Tribolium castaneum]|uniref:Uncharacterized protein n=1 Tax=Tribolium castaneum TaxID=7070 RepID=A0A139WLB8_TRICA|nr:hypothetical protein TcasGA2_TC033394 [Tribolium castaneum]
MNLIFMGNNDLSVDETLIIKNIIEDVVIPLDLQHHLSFAFINVGDPPLDDQEHYIKIVHFLNYTFKFDFHVVDIQNLLSTEINIGLYSLYYHHYRSLH